MNEGTVAESPPDRTNKTNGTNGAAPTELVQRVPLAEIVRSPWNRTIDTKASNFQTFAANVKERGVEIPLLCRPLPSALDAERKPGVPRLELVAGERRWLAAGLAKLPDVPVIVRKLTDREALELQAIENEQRQDTTAIEKAEKYQQLLDEYTKTGMPKEAAIAELCKQLSVGKTSEIGKSTVYETLRLLKLPAAVQEKVKSGALPASHAGLIAKLPGKVQSRVALALAPGRPVENYRAEEKLEKDTGISVQYERDPENGLVSFRDAKEIVDFVLADLDRAARYEQVAAKFRAEGGTAIPFEDARKNAANFISLSGWSQEFRQYVLKLVKGVPDLPKQIMRPTIDQPDIPEMVYRRDELMAALKKAGVKPIQHNDSMADYNRRQRQRLAKERIKKEVLKATIEPIRNAAGKRNAKIPWPLFVTMAGWTAHQICKRRGWKADYRNAGQVLRERLAKMPENQMAGVVADILVEKLTTAHTGSYQPDFVQLGNFYGVDVNAIAKEVQAKLAPPEKKAPAKEEKPKVQTSGTSSAKAAAVKKAKKKSRGLTPAARKKLTEAMKARCAERRKAAVNARS